MRKAGSAGCSRSATGRKTSSKATPSSTASARSCWPRAPWRHSRSAEMSRLRVAAYSVSVDGFGAGPNQGLDNPLGEGVFDVMGWLLQTKAFRSMHGPDAGGETGVDNAMAEKSFENVGAWIMGRNMFGPV